MIDPFDIVSWDVDGTLYDMSRLKRAIIGAALREMLSRHAVATVREMVLLGRFRSRMAKIRAEGGILGPKGIPQNRERIIAAERRWYGPAIARIGLPTGVQTLIDALDDAGVRQIVVSDYRSEYKLKALGLEGRFAQIYAGEQLGHLKPSAELLRIVAANENVAPNRILHIGDREDTDGIAARAVGCQVVILGRSFATASELLQALQKGPLNSR